MNISLPFVFLLPGRKDDMGREDAAALGGDAALGGCCPGKMLQASPAGPGMQPAFAQLLDSWILCQDQSAMTSDHSHGDRNTFMAVCSTLLLK